MYIIKVKHDKVEEGHQKRETTDRSTTILGHQKCSYDKNDEEVLESEIL